MSDEITEQQAWDALATIERGRRSVVAHIDLPSWYYASLAIGWIVLGVLSDLHLWWLTASATLVFGAAHSTIAPHVTSGRHGHRGLSVDPGLVGRAIPRYVALALIALVGLTVGLALAAAADGARHPSTIAAVVVAVMIVLGGPLLMRALRRHAMARTA